MSTEKHHVTLEPNGSGAALLTTNNGAHHQSVADLPTLLQSRSPADRPLPCPPRDEFWPRPRPLDRDGYVNGWYDPPVSLPAKEEAEGLATWLESEGHTGQAHALRLSYHRAEHARQELERLVQESAERLSVHNQRAHQENALLNEKIAAAEQRLQEAQQALEEARQQATRLLSAAGLPCDPTALDMAVFKQVPSSEAFAGGGGFIYHSPVKSGLRPFDLLAPVIIGFMAALCLATLTGLVELTDLNRLAVYWPKFLVVGLLGSAMVYLCGAMVSRFTPIMARHILEREPGQPPQKVKRWGPSAVLLVSALCIVAVMTAEIAVEGIGIRDLNTQRVAVLARLSGQGVSESSLAVLPFWLVLLIGMVITMPYIFSKMAKAWDECEASLRENWVLHLQHERVKERLKDEKVQAAAQAAAEALRCQSEVERLQGEVARLQSQRQPLLEEFDPETELRIETARVAASGAAASFLAHVERVVETLDPLRPKPWWLHWFERRPRARAGHRLWC